MVRWRRSLVSRTAVVASNDRGSAFAVDGESAFGLARWLWSYCSCEGLAVSVVAMVLAVADVVL